MKLNIDRIQLTIRDVKAFLENFSDDDLVYCAPSILKLNKSDESQEFIEEDRRMSVAMEAVDGMVTFGYIKRG